MSEEQQPKVILYDESGKVTEFNDFILIGLKHEGPIGAVMGASNIPQGDLMKIIPMLLALMNMSQRVLLDMLKSVGFTAFDVEELRKIIEGILPKFGDN